MGDEKAAAAGDLSKIPDAFLNQSKEVTLSDGSTVKVWKWSWLKFQVLSQKVGALGAQFDLAVQSVKPEDRERVGGLEPGDILEIATAAADFNMTPAVMRNFPKLVRASGEIVAALTSKPQSSQS